MLTVAGSAIYYWLLCLFHVTAAELQAPFIEPDHAQLHVTKNVAIIGAGSAGSSTAYYLRQYADEAGFKVNITVFERNNYIGGRSTTVDVYDDADQPAELGASIFVQVNHNLVNAVKAFNLSTSSLRSEATTPGPALGVWDGQEFVYVQDGRYSYFDIAKLFWKYGLAPYRTVQLMKSTIASFLKMYEAPHFPFSSLSETAYELGLTAATAATAEQYLRENGISNAFASDIVQASTRVNYAQNLSQIHGLEAMVCMAADGAMAVEVGNWRIFEAMLKASGASVFLDQAVTTVTKSDDGRYSLRAPAPSDSHDAPAQGRFDEVVLAAPHQFADIEFYGMPMPAIDKIPYVALHVTLFTSRHLLAPKAFDLESNGAVPRTVLTTLGQEDRATAPDFFSISLLDEVVDTRQKHAPKEYLYKVFSAEPMSDGFLARILGLDHHDTDAEIDKSDVSWMFRKLWNSYPYEYPRITFEKIKLDDGLWYTSGIESFISTMETSSLMGKNVAKLIVDEWIAST